MFDGKAFGEQMVEIVRTYVDEATAPLRAKIEALEARALPAAEIGPAGRDGIDGKDVDMDAVMARVDEALKAIPAPPAGKDGRDGVDGKDGVPGRDGIDGKDGPAGPGVRGAIRAHDGSLHLTLSDGSTVECGVVTGRDGRDGEPGPNGRDGLQLKDIDLALAEDGRTLVLSLDDGETAYKAEIAVSTMIYRGVFVDGKAYAKGDTVTWAGSLWHCNGETKDKPGEGSDLWTLAVKKGRDAKPVSLV